MASNTDVMSVSEVFNIDCMEYMKSIPDKFFELAVVDTLKQNFQRTIQLYFDFMH